MTKVSAKHTADTATPATGEQFSMSALESRLEVLRNGACALMEMASGEGIQPRTGDAVSWIVGLMQEAEQGVEGMFSSLIRERRQDWDSRDAALAELRAYKSAKEVAQA